MSDPLNTIGSLMLNSNETKWYAALLATTNNYVSVLFGDTSTNSMLKNFYTDNSFTNVAIGVS